MWFKQRSGINIRDGIAIWDDAGYPVGIGLRGMRNNVLKNQMIYLVFEMFLEIVFFGCLFFPSFNFSNVFKNQLI